jgi:phosphocarrier protein
LVTVPNRLGMHARAAARFVHLAQRFQARVTVSRGGLTMEGKSILGVLLLAACQGAELELQAEGEDAEQALSALAALVAGGSGEEA